MKVFQEYQKAPDVTRQRLFLETMERVFKGTDKIIIDGSANGGTGVVPYLPLNEINRGRQPTSQPGTSPPRSSQATTVGGLR